MNQGQVTAADASSALPNPTDFVDYQTLQNQAQQIQQNMSRQLAQTAADLENQRQIGSLRADFNKTLDEAIGQHAVLLTFHDKEEIGELIRKDVAALKPMTPEQAKQAIVERVQARATRVNSHLEELRKQQAVEAAKKVTSIEPPGGTPPSPPQTNFKLGDKGLAEAAIRYIEANATRR